MERGERRVRRGEEKRGEKKGDSPHRVEASRSKHTDPTDSLLCPTLYVCARVCVCVCMCM